MMAGALVRIYKQGDIAWVLDRRMPDGRWKCVSKLVDNMGHQSFSSRTAGEREMVVVQDAPTYQVGTTVEHKGKSFVVVADNGDSLTAIVPASRRPLKGGGYLHVPAGNRIELPKSDLTLETLT